MGKKKLSKAILVDGQVLIAQEDGSYRPADLKTDWKKVKGFTDDDVEVMAGNDGEEATP